MPAAREQAGERRLDGVRLQVERGDVAVQVVDRDERQPARKGERLRCRKADEERADQPGTRRDGDAIDVVERHTGHGKRLVEHGREELQVVA